MRLHIFALLAASAAALLSFSCGGSQPAANPPSTGSDASAPVDTNADADASSSTGSSAADAAAASQEDFDSLPKDKKVEVMATKVVPNVGKLFKEHDGKKFDKFGCQTCHGREKSNPQDPHKVLPKLTFSNGGFEKLSKSKPEMMKFMGEKVVPTMAAALGEKPFDPATKQGFGCGGCHTVD
jgi:hypothetical protein